MKKAFFILSAAMAFTFYSCTEESRSHDSDYEIEVRSKKLDCDKFLEQADVFVPDSEEQSEFFKNIKDPKNISEAEVDKYVSMLGFKDVESLYKNLVSLSKDDCLAEIMQENSQKNKAGCTWSLFNCVLDAIADVGHGTNNAFLEIVDFILDIMGCAADFNDCVE